MCSPHHITVLYTLQSLASEALVDVRTVVLDHISRHRIDAVHVVVIQVVCEDEQRTRLQTYREYCPFRALLAVDINNIYNIDESQKHILETSAYTQIDIHPVQFDKYIITQYTTHILIHMVAYLSATFLQKLITTASCRDTMAAMGAYAGPSV